MSRMKFPLSEAVSPEDGTQERCETDSGKLSDDNGNSVLIDQIAGSRPLQKLKMWMANNFPKRKALLPKAHDRTTQFTEDGHTEGLATEFVSEMLSKWKPVNNSNSGDSVEQS